MNTELLYQTYRYNGLKKIGLCTREYLINGTSILLRVKLSDDTMHCGCMIGVRRDALLYNHSKIREFDWDFIKPHVDEAFWKKLHNEEYLSKASTNLLINTVLGKLFDKLLTIAVALIKSHELTSRQSSAIIDGGKDNDNGDSVLEEIEQE